MVETLTFHFEGALADAHRMNFYEAARFQYAAARLMVKLAQFRQSGRFVQKISNKSNFDVQLKSQSDGSFNINVEDMGNSDAEGDFVNISISDLISFVSERVIEKIDETTLKGATSSATSQSISGSSSLPIPISAIDRLADDVMSGRVAVEGLPSSVRDLVRRRVAEAHREQRMEISKAAISRIDFARSQKLVAMSAPLISEMATALRKSANTLEVRSSARDDISSVLFLDQKMAQEIETAIVDEEISPVLGDVIQFNKDNGWGKLKAENGLGIISFSIPYDILPKMRKSLIDSMNKDMIFLQTYFVRNRGGDVVRLIAVGVLPAPI